MILVRGENAIVQRSILDADGNPVVLDSCLSISADVMAMGRVLYSTVYPSEELRQGIGASNLLELEVTGARSARFPWGSVSVRWRIKVPDSVYTTDPGQIDIVSENVFSMR